MCGRGRGNFQLGDWQNEISTFVIAPRIATFVHSTFCRYVMYVHPFHPFHPFQSPSPVRRELWIVWCGNPKLLQVFRVGPIRIEGELKEIPPLCMCLSFVIGSRGLCAFVLLVVAMLMSSMSLHSCAEVEKAVVFRDGTENMFFGLWIFFINLSKYVCVWSNSDTLTYSDLETKTRTVSVIRNFLFVLGRHAV